MGKRPAGSLTTPGASHLRRRSDDEPGSGHRCVGPRRPRPCHGCSGRLTDAIAAGFRFVRDGVAAVRVPGKACGLRLRQQLRDVTVDEAVPGVLGREEQPPCTADWRAVRPLCDPSFVPSPGPPGIAREAGLCEHGATDRTFAPTRQSAASATSLRGNDASDFVARRMVTDTKLSFPSQRASLDRGYQKGPLAVPIRPGCRAAAPVRQLSPAWRSCCASGDVRKEQLVGPFQVTVDTGDLDGISPRKTIDEALILVGVAASGRDELRRYPLVLAPRSGSPSGLIRCCPSRTGPGRSCAWSPGLPPAIRDCTPPPRRSAPGRLSPWCRPDR